MASRERQRPECDDTPVADPPGSPGMLWFVLILAGYLLFAHGCHADEDTELRVREFITCWMR
jgi:hypothetical protein